MSSLAYKDKGATGHNSFFLGILKVKDNFMHMETHDTKRLDYLILRLYSKSYLCTPAELLDLTVHDIHCQCVGGI